MQLVSSIRYNTTASCERATATATATCFKVDGNEVYRIIIIIIIFCMSSLVFLPVALCWWALKYNNNDNNTRICIAP